MENINVDVKQIEELLQTDSEQEYVEKLKQLISIWSKLFVEYFDNIFDQTIRACAAKCVFEKFDLYNPFYEPEKAPYFCDSTNQWHLSNVMTSVQAPACQTHHNHRDILKNLKKKYLLDS